MKLTRRVDLRRLQAELAAAGITVPALGTNGDDLHTYDADGALLDLPPAAQAVLNAHVPPPAFVPPDYDDDDADGTGTHLAQAVASLRQYRAADTPTQAQTVAALKLTIRLVLLLARRSFVRPLEG